MYRLVASATGTACRQRAAWATAVHAPLCTARRAYYWPYNEDFVPAGAATSSFQSSGVPSVRARIVREYALGPLFGARTPCCRLGFAQPARALLPHKAALRAQLAALLSCDPADLRLGDLEQTKEMLLHREALAEAPRLADGAGTKDAAARRRRQYAREPVVAHTVVAVYYAPNGRSAAVAEDEAEEEELLAMGLYIQDALASAAAAGETAPPAAAALQRLGVVHCEVPLVDSSDYVFDELHGEAVDEGLTARVWERWERRLAQMDELHAAATDREKAATTAATATSTAPQ
ncbi:hypothetical protein STCU_05986 [Strigomonas culicis]|uniref:Uncharacterized protein n=1 Tax=Strigomonas culicis TaxID=28005 RepID=S9U8A3_9TRYP|nr:hypothetical protein STCU_05986 [Strigomonas culicis]|eukprot:EPY26972.1 hypothetical protein STCU_05986 [Strigomonas culicis]